MIEKPIQTFQGNIAIDALVDIERTRNRFVIGRMQPPWPAILSKDAYNLF